MAQSHLKLFDVFLYSSAFSWARVCYIDPFLKAIVLLVESLQIVNEVTFFQQNGKILHCIWFLISIKNILQASWFSMHNSVVLYKFNDLFLSNFSSLFICGYGLRDFFELRHLFKYSDLQGWWWYFTSIAVKYGPAPKSWFLIFCSNSWSLLYLAACLISISAV